MEDILKFFKLLDKKIVPAKSENNLRPAHSLHLSSADSIEVNLYPLNGGEYHIPVKVTGRSIGDIVDEVETNYRRCLFIRAMS